MAYVLMAARTVAMYAYLLVAMRFAGKRELGQVSPFDLVVAVMIGELAAIPLEGHKTPLITGFVPIAVIVIAQILTAYVSLRSDRFRAFINGRPTILIAGGEIRQKALRQMRYSLNDLLAHLRLKGIANIEDVEFAILEDNGDLSVIPKSQKRPATPADLQLPTSYEGLPYTLILDGQVDYGSLTAADIDYTWLKSQLSAQGFADPAEVLLGMLSVDGKVTFFRRKDR